MKFQNYNLTLLPFLFLFISNGIFYYSIVPSDYYTDLVAVSNYLAVYATKFNFSFDNFGVNLLEFNWHNTLVILNYLNIDLISFHIILLSVFSYIYSINLFNSSTDKLILMLIFFIGFPVFSNILIGNTKSLLSLVLIMLFIPNFFRANMLVKPIRYYSVFFISSTNQLGFTVLLFAIRFTLSHVGKRFFDVKNILGAIIGAAVVYFFMYEKAISLFSYYVLSINNVSYNYFLSWHFIMTIVFVMALRNKIVPIKMIIGFSFLGALGVPMSYRFLDIIPLFYLHYFFKSIDSDVLIIYVFFNLILYVFYLIRFL